MAGRDRARVGDGVAGELIGVPMNASPTREQALDLYYYLRLNRSLEELLARLFRQNKIAGGLYGSLGQEAISVGAAYALGPGDWIAPMIRNIGALLVRGFKPRDILTQHMARYTSPTQGKDGTIHVGDLTVRHVVAPISMLGDLIPVMTGVAMAGRYLGQKIVAMTWIGDGGTSTGAFHEGLNFAAVQKAPLVLVIENNQWAYSTPVSRQAAAARLGRPRARLRHRRPGGRRQRCRRRVECGARSRGARTRRRWPRPDRSQNHAHDRPRAARRRGICAAAKCSNIGKRATRSTATKNISPRMRLWDEKSKAEIDARIERELAEDLAFAENSPFPPPELAEQGVYCEGCHTIEAEWQRAKEEVMPPKSSVAASLDGHRFRRRRSDRGLDRSSARADAEARQIKPQKDRR